MEERWFDVDLCQGQVRVERWFAFCVREANPQEDLVQNSLLRLWRAYKKGHEITPAYIEKVCESVWYDHLRRLHRQPPTYALEDYTAYAVGNRV